jgi:Zn-dependent protease
MSEQGPRGAGDHHDGIAQDVAGDWRFRIGPVPVVVRRGVVALVGSFVAAVVLGFLLGPTGEPGYVASLIGTLGAFVLVVLSAHELGHALAVRSLGLRPKALVLNHWGPGVAVPSEELDVRPFRDRARVALAGPAADFTMVVVFAVALVMSLGAGWVQQDGGAMVLFGGGFAAAVHLPMNLVPMPPADMGKLLRSRRVSA